MPPATTMALIMAAGQSRRFGRDKRQATLPGGQTLLQATVELARKHFDHQCVVIGEGDNPAELSLPDSVTLLHAPGYDIGLGTSIARAFEHLLASHCPAQTAAVMLGDMPWIQNDTLLRLGQMANATNIVRPVYREQPGHPVWFGRTFWPALAELSGDDGAKSVVRGNRSSCEGVVVDDEGVVKDVDRPEDLGR